MDFPSRAERQRAAQAAVTDLSQWCKCLIHNKKVLLNFLAI